MKDRIGVFWRGIAALFDTGLILFCDFLVLYCFGPIDALGHLFSGALSFGALFALVRELGFHFSVVLPLTALAYMSSEVFLAATPGKLVCGIAIGQSDGTLSSYRQLVTRFLFKQGAFISILLAHFTGLIIFFWLGALLSLIFFLGLLLILLPRRQTLHDLLAGTAVYAVEREWSVEQPSATSQARCMPLQLKHRGWFLAGLAICIVSVTFLAASQLVTFGAGILKPKTPPAHLTASFTPADVDSDRDGSRDERIRKGSIERSAASPRRDQRAQAKPIYSPAFEQENRVAGAVQWIASASNVERSPLPSSAREKQINPFPASKTASKINASAELVQYRVHLAEQKVNYLNKAGGISENYDRTLKAVEPFTREGYLHRAVAREVTGLLRMHYTLLSENLSQIETQLTDAEHDYGQCEHRTRGHEFPLDASLNAPCIQDLASTLQNIEANLREVERTRLSFKTRELKSLARLSTLVEETRLLQNGQAAAELEHLPFESERENAVDEGRSSSFTSSSIGERGARGDV